MAVEARYNLEFLIFNRSGLCLCHIDLLQGEIMPNTSNKGEESTPD